ETQRLTQHVRERLFVARRAEFLFQGSDASIWGKIDAQHDAALARDRLAQNIRQGIETAALQPLPGDHGFAAHRAAAERQRNALERRALEAAAKDVGPVDQKAA